MEPEARSDATAGTAPDQSDDATVQVTMRRDLAAGELVGRYRIVRLLGRGGMGSVYYAERADELARLGGARTRSSLDVEIHPRRASLRRS